MTRLATVCLMLRGCSACTLSGTPHDHCHAVMSNDVGQHKTRALIGRYPRDVLARAEQPNGNEEVTFIHRRSKGESCLVFFEVDRETGIVVSWRFEGTEEVCIWIP